jgi:hypothetical protein
VVPVLRLLDIAAAAAGHFGIAVREMLIALGRLREAAEKVSLREILPGFTEIFLSHAEVTSSSIVVVMVVMVMVMMATMAALGALAALAAEKTTQCATQQVSDKRGREACETKHSIFSFFVRDARACFMPTLGCLQTWP